MGTIVKWGVILGLLVEAWTFMMGFTGWYKNPALITLFFVVIPIQVTVLVFALRETAAAGRRYWGQVTAGTLVSAVAGVLIVVGGLLFTTVVFPSYFQDLAAVQEQMLRQAGQTEEQIRTAMDAYRNSNTPMSNAMAGFVGCFLTGLCASLVIAAFVRTK